MIFIVVAMFCEAKPLIRHYGLKARMPMGRFRVYESEDVSLVISGVGKVASAAAVAYLYALYGEIKGAVWLNIGLAGHKNMNIGSCFLVDKVVDIATGRSWYPGIVFPASCTDMVYTVDVVETEYQKAGGYDMEAAGFYSIASSFSTVEFVHCIKIVCDTPETPVVKDPGSLIDLDFVDDIIIKIKDLLSSYVEENMEKFLVQWHFTVTQRCQLKKVLKKWRVVFEDSAFDRVCCCDSSKAVLSKLEKEILGVRFSVC